MKYLGKFYKHFKIKKMVIILKNNISVGLSSVLCDRYVESDKSKNMLYIDAYNLYVWAMSQSLPYDEI